MAQVQILFNESAGGRWEKGGTELARHYVTFYGKQNGYQSRDNYLNRWEKHHHLREWSLWVTGIRT